MSETSSSSVSFVKFILFHLWCLGLNLSLYPGKMMVRFWSYCKRIGLRVQYGLSTKRVVVIGGGFAGTEVAKTLQHLMDVHLIDTKEFFEFTPSVLRTLVVPETVKQIQILHSEYLSETTFHHGTVEKIDPVKSSVTYESIDEKEIKEIAYDYLVICSGSSYHQPFKNPNVVISTRAKDLIGCAERVVEAEAIVIIGGGTVGVELAAEIITQYPNKQVTIVHSGETLLTRNDPKAGLYAKDFLDKHGVNLLLNQKVDVSSFKADYSLDNTISQIHFKTDIGTNITANLAFMCTGMWPNSKFLQNFKDQALDERGFVRVNEHLQSHLGSNIFICGDVTDIKEEKLAQAAGNAAAIAIDNILKVNKRAGKDLSEYKPSYLPIIVSLGKYEAIFTWKNFSFQGFLPALAKEAVQWKVMVTY